MPFFELGALLAQVTSFAAQPLAVLNQRLVLAPERLMLDFEIRQYSCVPTLCCPLPLLVRCSTLQLPSCATTTAFVYRTIFSRDREQWPDPYRLTLRTDHVGLWNGGQYSTRTTERRRILSPFS